MKGDVIEGRDAVDMKSSVAAMILAIRELSKNKNLKYQPVLLLTSDEEANGFTGIKNCIRMIKRKVF